MSPVSILISQLDWCVAGPSRARGIVIPDLYGSDFEMDHYLEGRPDSRHL